MGSNLIFITGACSSGTTAVRSGLWAHPDCVSCFETSIGLSLALSLEDHNHRPHWVTKPERYGLSKPARLTTRGAMPDILASYNKLIDYHRSTQGGRIFIDKSPHNLDYIPMLHDIWPNAPVVFTARHPLSWIPSIMARSMATPVWAMPNAKRSVPDACEAWNYVADKLMGMEDVIVVPAEHVVEELPGVFHYCGLEWKKDYLNWAKYVTPKLNIYRRGNIKYANCVMLGKRIQNMPYRRINRLTPEQRKYIVANTDWEMLYPAVFTEGLLRHARNMDSR